MSQAKVLVADPPWQFSDKLTMSEVKRGAEANYATLPIADLLRLPIERWTLLESICTLWVPTVASRKR